MKILIINQSDLGGGASRAIHRIAQHMIDAGHDVEFRVMRKLGQDIWVTHDGSLFRRILSRILPRLDLALKFILGINPKFSWSINAYPFNGIDISDFELFDIIHINWIGKNSLTFDSLSKINIPIVWTLHDSWAFTGGCHVPGSCEQYKVTCTSCPQLKKLNLNPARYVYENKSRAYRNLNMHFVAPSLWMASLCKSSSLLSHFPVSVIPNGLDIKQFKPLQSISETSEEHCVRKKIILFGAMNSDSDSNKGFDIFVNAIKNLCSRHESFVRNIVIHIFGNAKDISNCFPVECHCFGFINNEAALAALYANADITVVPSLFESFGQVAVESMACGTPVVAFDTSGLKDIVSHKIDGYLAKPFDVTELSEGIIYSLRHEVNETMSINARKKVLDNFDINVVAKSYAVMYDKIVND